MRLVLCSWYLQRMRSRDLLLLLWLVVEVFVVGLFGVASQMG